MSNEPNLLAPLVDALWNFLKWSYDVWFGDDTFNFNSFFDSVGLKNKLDEEGLFLESHKMKVPEYPEVVGVITALTGEAINDIISTFNRRLPLAKIKLFPAIVQGDEAPKSLIKALDLAYKDDTQVTKIEVEKKYSITPKIFITVSLSL